MTIKATIDSAGRVLIPKAVRDELRLGPGDRLDLELEGDHVVLRPARSGTSMRKENGVWVFRSGREISAAETERALHDLRQARDRATRGSKV
jgi:AbrB family looped-hinge helix DNA binding protein